MAGWPGSLIIVPKQIITDLPKWVITESRSG